MKKDKFCIICGKATPSTLAIASYCSACRGIVSKIVNKVKIAMGTQDIEPASGPCVDCGRPADCWDHRYYSLPFEVEAMCTRCNINRGPALDVVELGQQMLGIGKPALVVDSLPEKLDKSERQAVEHAIGQCKGNHAAAARMLGIGYRSMRYRVKRLGITV